jgi:phosphoglycolate phosphatase
VLFDFDGTLIDSYRAIAASVNHIRATHGLPPLPVDEVRSHVGRGPEHLLRLTVPAGDVAANVAAYKAHHPSVLRSGTQLLPGAAELLAALHGRGLLLAVCSNKPVAFTRELLDILALARYFHAVLGPEDVPHPKPAPDMLRVGLARLHVEPQQALYIGDMTVDVETARAAGVPVWVVATGSDTAEALARAAPDRLLTGLAQAVPLLTR